ncbi:MAG: peptidoglycan DD-metalloendopeptidase family protein [Anaerolineae bacterium]
MRIARQPGQAWRRKPALWGLLVALLWLSLGAAPGAWAADSPPQDQGPYLIHVVQAGETLSEIAAAYGVAVDVLTTLNGLENPNRVVVGQKLRIPVTRRLVGTSPLPSPLVLVHAVPLPVAQGSTLSIRAVTDTPAHLRGWLGEQEFSFFQAPDGYWGLAAIHPLATPGCHPLTLEVLSEGETGKGWSACVWVGVGDFGTQRIPLSPEMGGILANQGAVQAEASRIRELYAQVSGPPLWRGPFRWPLEGPLKITAPFGDRRAYGDGPPSSFHEGLDLDAPEGTEVRAPAIGRVVLAEKLWVRGNAVVVDHGQGVFTGYWHLAEVEVSAGQLVWPGRVLGRVGNTGLSTGAHLHWELRVNGVPVDPAQWVTGQVASWPTWPSAMGRAVLRRPGARIPP